MIEIDLSKQQALDVDPNQYNKLVLLEIYKISITFQLLKKRKKLF